MIETGELRQSDHGISSDRDIELDGNEPVSMNVWGFTPDLFDYLQSMFVDFLEKEGNEMKSEYLIQSVVNDLIRSGQEKVHVLRSNEAWFCLTYKKDRTFVLGEIQKLIQTGVYPEKLFA